MNKRAAPWFSQTEMLTFQGLVGLPHHSAIMCKAETKLLEAFAQVY